MLNSPKELLITAKRALETKRKINAQEKKDRAKLNKLRIEFELVCLTAALEQKTSVYFDRQILEVFDFSDFQISEVEKDDAHEKSLNERKNKLEKYIITQIEDIKIKIPEFASLVSFSYLATDLHSLLIGCAKYGSPMKVLEAIKIELRKIASINENELPVFANFCNDILPYLNKLEALNVALVHRREINFNIPDNVKSIIASWDGASAEYKKSTVLNASKLKWISTIWPSWEKYFNEDIEIAAKSGKTSRIYEFLPDVWSDNNSFIVQVENFSEDDSLWDEDNEDREFRLYWKRNESRNENRRLYDSDEGMLFGVKPLPIAEIFSQQGFGVKIIERSYDYSNEESNTDRRTIDREITLVDLENCSAEFDYKLEVSWLNDETDTKTAKGKEKE